MPYLDLGSGADKFEEMNVIDKTIRPERIRAPTKRMMHYAAKREDEMQRGKKMREHEMREEAKKGIMRVPAKRMSKGKYEVKV